MVYGLTTLPQFSPEQMIKKDMYDYILITIDTSYANMCKFDKAESKTISKYFYNMAKRIGNTKYRNKMVIMIKNQPEGPDKVVLIYRAGLEWKDGVLLQPYFERIIRYNVEGKLDVQPLF